MSKLEIKVNLSIERSGGAENLNKVIEETLNLLKNQYPEAEIDVRKGYFKTIDGIWASDAFVEQEVKTIVAKVRNKVIS